MKNLLKILFFIILASIIFEGGFYFGSNYRQIPVSSSLPSLSRQIAVENPRTTIAPGTVKSDYQLFGQSPPTNPAIKSDILDFYIFPLRLVDQGLLKETTLSTVYIGKIASIGLNEKISPATERDKQFENVYLSLSLQNPSTGIITNVDNILKDKVLSIWSGLNGTDKLQPLDASQLAVGDTVEFDKTVDLLNDKTTKRDIILLKKGK